mmetsp:Transcript_7169/g.22941  ORF Transcript_7169/g.22941 Transcript_7169/m.22941 type:complete len:189 (-) Transcript_7169:43-609(-)
MTTVRRLTAFDLFSYGNINLDPLTATYYIPFYFDYFVKWPEYNSVAVAPTTGGSCSRTGGDCSIAAAYVLGKAEGEGAQWHGHVTAVTVAPEYRLLGLGSALMDVLEAVSTEIHDAFFVDLFVRSQNKVGISWYEKLGYSVYRRVLKYYVGPPEDDGLDMRKAMPRDKEKKSVIPFGRDVTPYEIGEY